jgi:hypothetical protein
MQPREVGSHGDKMGECRWQKITWNFKRTGRRMCEVRVHPGQCAGVTVTILFLASAQKMAILCFFFEAFSLQDKSIVFFRNVSVNPRIHTASQPLTSLSSLP